ncbi:MAG: LysR family transcriptional regulator [Chloroflexi bacterium]|nr:LysR family transcriptional regulator [Chloroflexota bacterium]
MYAPNLHQLQVFYVVATRQSMAKAAEELYLHQSSVSLQISRLEKHYGVALLERTGRGVRVTEAGKVVYETARKIFQILHETQDGVDELRSLQAGHLNIAANWPMGLHILPSVFEAFRATYPGIDLTITIGSRQNVEQSLLREAVDLGFCSSAVESGDLENEVLATAEIVVICAPSSPLAARKTLTPEVVSRHWFLNHYEAESGTRVAYEKVFGDLGISIRAKADVAGVETVKSGVARGEGISMLPRALVYKELAAGLLCASTLSGIDLTSQLYVCYQKGKVLSATSLAFLDVARTHVARLPGISPPPATSHQVSRSPVRQVIR